MIRTLKFLLNSQLKRSQVIAPVGGFTLIELLVGMILAVLIITPLMGFMVNILDTDRREQAKANSEQEIQAALDYISRDLQQAIYIYDADGVTRDSNSNPTLSGIKNQIPPGCDSTQTNTSCQPILVFWKRELVKNVIKNASTDKDKIDDTFVYSLVAYYLLKDANATWSPAARITRWQIKDGVADASASAVSCPGYTGKYISDYCPSAGFALFNLNDIGSLKDKMNSWTRIGQYTTQTTGAPDVVTKVSYSASTVLVDFIDQTTTGAPAATCPTGSKISHTTMTSFYSCIDTVNTTAQVFLRGNAVARLQTNNLNYKPNQKTYFPTASIQIQGRGYLFTK